MPRIFAYYRDTEARRAALAADEKDAGPWMGLFDLAARGWETDLNLRATPGPICRFAGNRLSNLIHGNGGYGGDFAGSLKSLPRANRADVVWSTVDTLGLPLAVLKRAGVLRKPLVYTSIGLVERFRALPDSGWKRWQMKALGQCAALTAFGWEEAEVLREWFPRTPVHFLPFGVDTDAWTPLTRPKTVDVLSLGMDWQRDFACLLPFARAHPDKTLKIITSPHLRETLTEVPPNVSVSDPVPLPQIREEMAAARVIALPVKENTYSGATTTLLQAMATGRPTVVSGVGAIRGGYGFEAQGSCILTPPGDPEALADRLTELLADPDRRNALGTAARRHAEAAFSRGRFADAWAEIFEQIVMEKPPASP